MQLPKNSFKAALAQGRQQIGIWSTIAGGAPAELLACAGFDWILIDTEHAPLDLSTVHNMLQAIAPYPSQAVVRPGWNDPVEIKRLLDIGAQSLLIPYVQTVDEARRAVASVRYAPEGMRGVAYMTRAARYGQIPNYIQDAAREICLLLQVETASALSEIEGMAALDGVDGIFIGPADLSASMGLPGQASHPKVKAAVLDAVRRIRACGKAAGVLTLDQDFTAELIKAGTNFTAVDVDTAILARGLAQARARYPS